MENIYNKLYIIYIYNIYIVLLLCDRSLKVALIKVNQSILLMQLSEK